MSKASLRAALPLITVFVFVSAIAIIARERLESKGFSTGVLLWGNLIVFLIIFLAFLIAQKTFTSSNSSASIRAIYSGFIIRFFALAAAAFIYILVAQKQLNKPALFTCMGLYIVYTALEISALLRLLKQQKNA